MLISGDETNAVPFNVAGLPLGEDASPVALLGIEPENFTSSRAFYAGAGMTDSQIRLFLDGLILTFER